MDAIKSYLENMFLHLPKTPEVMRAKEELSQMMEDKYNQLRSEGSTDNEAVGQVIAEFGNLAELAGDLGISNELSEIDFEEPELVSMTDQDVERYLQVSRESGRQIAGGVGLILFGVIVLIILQAIADGGFLVENIAQAIGIGVLLLMVAIAVYMFIMAGIKTDQYENMETKIVKIDPYLRDRIKNQKKEYLPSFGRLIAIGVLLILLGVIILVTITILEVANTFVQELLVACLLAMVAIAVSLFITSSAKMSAYDKLLNEGEYTRQKKEEANIMQTIAGLYWMLVLGGYLAWSFIDSAWHISWVVWPIAGVLYATISNIAALVRRNR